MPNKTIDPAIVVAGGVNVPVTTFAGEQITVFVPLLFVDKLKDFCLRTDDYAALAEYVAGQEAGWARKTLPPLSLLEVVKAAMDLNFEAACKWAELQASLTAAARGLEPQRSSPSAPPSATPALTPAS